ncbi:Formyltransferase/hydrolase complex Fhc subunit C [Planctomycetes bacterium CA13]|uniref:Formyltransferase/hydrolase complex Fhc subunit C n=1 Tax=Novipirellula herctigrandis TaxID=2527986 RepID=A0A5C5Z050_9BACT|nr:Formyltransferase/hydrolase complex Fhc subunit C [Planctomycetes bacterium CA13]
MNGWTFELKPKVEKDVDASPIHLDTFKGKAIDEVRAIPLSIGKEICSIGDLFLVKKSNQNNTIRLEGDLSHFHHIASAQQRGQTIVCGDVGDYLAAPTGARRAGMSGGRLIVSGSAGDAVGHRMRRGEIAINGSVGNLLAAHMVAGTIIVAGEVGRNCGYAMRRGTLCLSKLPDLCPKRFGKPTQFQTAFFSLMQKQWQEELQTLGSVGVDLSEITRLLDQIRETHFASVRGDFAVGGQGEMIVLRY